MKMNFNDWKFRHPLLFYAMEMTLIGFIILGFVIFGIMCVGCGAEAKSEIKGNDNTAKTDASATDDGSAKADKVEGNQNVKVINTSPWPYVFIITTLVVFFFAYLYFSKKYSGFGRGCTHG